MSWAGKALAGMKWQTFPRASAHFNRPPPFPRANKHRNDNKVRAVCK
jgi:hypothetical protein